MIARSSSRAAAPAAPAGSAAQPQAALRALVPWAIQRGISFAKVKPAQLPGGVGAGLLASFPIAPGEALVAVPTSATIRSHPRSAPPRDLVRSEAWPLLPWWARLALLLLAEQRAGSAGAFADYLAALPGEPVDVPALWSEAELAELRAAYFIEQVQQQRAEWDSLWRQLQPQLEAAAVSEAQLRWALSVVRSRTFAAPYLPLPLSAAPKLAAAASLAAGVAWLTGQGAAAAGLEALGLAAAGGLGAWLYAQAGGAQQHALAPLLDLFNHSSSIQSECELDVWSDSLRVVASGAWPAGAEVLINYAPGSSNDVLTQLYGFVDPGNPNDRYLVRCLPAQLGAAAAELAEVALASSGLAAATAAALEAACGGKQAGAGGAGLAGSVSYATLGPAARAALAAAVTAELAQLGVNESCDEAVLHALDQLPAKQQELAHVQCREQQVAARLQQLQEREAAMQAAAHQQPDSKGVGAGSAEPPAAVELAGLLSQCSEELSQLQHKLHSLQLLLDSWSALVAATPKPLAVRFRLAKARLLRSVLGQLQA